MGDIWPYGPPDEVPWDSVYNELLSLHASAYTANVLAAIGMAESTEDVTVINDDPGTGDYSVGVFQINYYGSLYNSRAAAFGTPEQLIAGGLPAQARAALVIAADGFTPWSTYNDGDYRQYLNGAIGAPAGTGTGGTGGSSAQPLLQEGDTGPAVVTLQDDLNTLGAQLVTDGDFGPLTLAAVLAFQRSRGLSADGVVGPLTWAALDTALQAGNTGQAAPSSNVPPNEPPAGLDSTVAASWSNLASQTGAYANSLLVKLGTYSSTFPGG